MLRDSARAIRVVVLSVVLSVPLAGCESFDPTTLTDFIPDSKKKLPGERKDVFPQGVPGVVQGVPQELVKGNQPPADASALAAPEIAEPPEPKVEEKPKPKPKPKTASNRSRPPASVAPEQAQRQQQQPANSPWPAQQPQQPQTAWPAPPPAR
jgi:hypothetical protein